MCPLCHPLSFKLRLSSRGFWGEFSMTLHLHHHPDIGSLGYQAWAVPCWGTSLIPTLKTCVDPTVLSATLMLCWRTVWLGVGPCGLPKGQVKVNDSSLFKLPAFSCFHSAAPFPSTCRIIFSNKTGVGSYLILFCFVLAPKHCFPTGIATTYEEPPRIYGSTRPSLSSLPVLLYGESPEMETAELFLLTALWALALVYVPLKRALEQWF